MRFEFRFSRPQAAPAARRRKEAPMRILVMGDFGGRGGRALADSAPLLRRPVVAVDSDNFDAVLLRFAPSLALAGAPVVSVALDFKRLEDFHPDSLYRRADVFRVLRDLRAGLHDPATFAQAAAALRRQPSVIAPAAGTEAAPEQQESAPKEDEAGTLERLLGRPPVESRHGGQSGGNDIQSLVRRIVAPYAVPDASPFRAQYVASVDMAASAQMRSILHHPTFQALEAIWCGVHRLVANLELGERLQLCVLDATKRELLADIDAAADNLDQSTLYRLLVERGRLAPGGEPWSVLVGHYSFGTSAEDVALLAALGAIASQAGGPFLAAADAGVLGCGSLVAAPDPSDWRATDDEANQRWAALRRSSAASWIGLSLPRLLLRLPYGKVTDRIEQFEFEEFASDRNHEGYLWGNPALACALLLGQSFLARGWGMEPGDELDIDGLPAHTFEQDGERHLQACAEVYISERAGEAILSRGVMPLLSYKNRNAVRVMRFQSVAQPAQPLSGPWYSSD